VFHSVIAVVLEVRNELVGPDVILTLVAMERRKNGTTLLAPIALVLI
jgi:hypothetical protein